MESTTTNSPNNNVLLYITIFFFAMILHELALEAATHAFHTVENLTSSVTLFQFGFCVLLPLLLSRGTALQSFPQSCADCVPYAKVTMAVFGATALATASLAYVSYPTKVVFKSAKLIPTMIVSTILNQKTSYGVLDYCAAACLCVGAAGYSYNSNSNAKGQDNSLYGVILLTVSIVCDALVPNLQQRLMMDRSAASSLPVAESGSSTSIENGEGGKGLTASELMVNVNAVGFSGLLIYMIVSGALFKTVLTALTHPALLGYLILVGLGLSTAVLAYTKLIKASGPVVAVTVATLRKVATVVLSYIVFPKPLLPVHVLSGGMVLVGITINTLSRQRRGTSK